jgi:hypothetical protein
MSIDHDADHAASLDAFEAQDAAGHGHEMPLYVAPACEDCGAELVATDYDDADGKLVQHLTCEVCSQRDEETGSRRVPSPPEYRAEVGTGFVICCRLCGESITDNSNETLCDRCAGPYPEQLELSLAPK